MTKQEPKQEGGALSRLRAGTPVFGAMQQIPSTVITEIAVRSGYEFVILDCEHGVVDEAAHLASLQILSASEAFSAVRVRPRDYLAVGRYLDFGADAILMPDLRSPEEAQTLVAAASYGPNGRRSSNGGVDARSSQYGLKKSADQEPLLFAMIESAEGVAGLAKIAAIPGIGGLVIGPHDLSADLGCSGDFTAPQFKDAVQRIERAAKAAGLILGGGAYQGLSVDTLLRAGHRFILAGSDTAALRGGFSADIGAVRGEPDLGMGHGKGS